jgi:alanyl-tRNA synthetase
LVLGILDKELQLPKESFSSQSLPATRKINYADNDSAGIWKVWVSRKTTFPSTDGKKMVVKSWRTQQHAIGEPGGPDSEVFYDFARILSFMKNSPWSNQECHPNCDCGRFWK